MLFFQLPALPEALFRARNFAILDRSMRDNAVQNGAISDADMEYFRAAFRNRYSITAAINYYRADIRAGFRARPGENGWVDRKIDAATLVIWGEQDFALGKELTYGMDPLFSGSFAIKYVADAGHWVQQEKPALVNQHLGEFLPPLLELPQ